MNESDQDKLKRLALETAVVDAQLHGVKIGATDFADRLMAEGKRGLFFRKRSN